MNIAIDGYEANSLPRVGIGRYAFEIIGGMHKLLAAGGKKHVVEDRVRVYLPEAPAKDLPPQTSWWRYRVAGPKQLWTFFALPIALSLQKPQPAVIFSPTHYAPRFVNIPRVISVMDTSYLVYPQLFTRHDLHQLIHWTRFSVRHAKRIFTISEFSKNAIIREYGVAPDSVVVTYPGITPLPSQDMEITELLKKYDLSPYYMLSVGTIQPRKNYVRLIEAFSIFLKNNKQKFRAIKLVIVGKKGWLFEETFAAPKKFGVDSEVKFLDFVSDSELDTLYTHALCLALPSLYEGFGLPVVEAMAHKIPVVVGNRSSLPEIAGKAGIYVDSESSEDIAKGLLTAIEERNLLPGRRRIQEGLKQLKLFSWEKAARQTLDVLTQVGEGKI